MRLSREVISPASGRFSRIRRLTCSPCLEVERYSTCPTKYCNRFSSSATSIQQLCSRTHRMLPVILAALRNNSERSRRVPSKRTVWASARTLDRVYRSGIRLHHGFRRARPDDLPFQSRLSDPEVQKADDDGQVPGPGTNLFKAKREPM